MTTLERFTEDRVNTAVASFVFLFTLAIYTITLTPTVPFWDSGEFIATSYILGVPHAPGTPLYVLLGRIFTLIPIATIAQRVNWFSALGSAVAILFTYLIGVRVTRRVFPWEEDSLHRPLAYVSGVVGAFLAAFATTFWGNAIEAEVYAASCALMALVVWLALRWEEKADRPNGDGALLVITYLVGLGVGIHLGVAVAAWVAVVFVFLVRPEYLKRWDYLGWALVTLSLGTGVHLGAFLVAPVVLALTLLFWLFTGKLRKLAFWSSLLFMVGVSVHFYLIIRSNLDPIINEAAPKTWHALWLMLIRDQYKPPPIWERKADFGYQFTYMYLRYMWWNFTLFFVKGRAFFQIPILLAVAGAYVNFVKERRTAIMLGVLFLLLGPALVVYLNFKVGEVRERDYFFVQNFQFLSIWVGLGAVWVVDWVRRQFRDVSGQKMATAILSAVFLAMSVMPLFANWRSHDRRGFYVARDYAYNMLEPLEPDAVIFTNGDNDTFPLWYLQEVEKIRKDVRVVNLSLLNTPWYIKQLRDLDPKVPISYTDEDIANLHPYRDQNGRIWMVKDLAVRNIMQTNRWKKPLYLAVTVPDVMGLDKQLTMEGLVFRIHPEPTDERIDVEKTLHNLHDVYQFRGLVIRDPNAPNGFGYPDSTVFKDDNTRKLVQNYAAAFSRAAIALYQQGKTEAALKEMEMAEVISPAFPGTALAKGILLEESGRKDEAIQHYRKMMEQYPNDWQLPFRLGEVLLSQGRPQDAIPYFERSSRLSPDQYCPFQGLVSAYYQLGRYQDALDALERLSLQHPEDHSIRQYVKELQASIRSGSLPQPGGTADTAGQGGSADTGAGETGKRDGN